MFRYLEKLGNILGNIQDRLTGMISRLYDSRGPIEAAR